MFQRLYNEAFLELRIALSGPVLVKASDTGIDPTRPDMEFVRTVYRGRRTIYLPGSTLKGILRCHCERLARTLQPEDFSKELSPRRLSCDPLDNEYSCSKQWKDKKGASSEQIYRDSCFVCRLFGNTALASRVRVSDAYPEDVDAIRVEERNGVAIDRVFGSVAHGPFNYEVAVSGAFTAGILVRNFTIAQLGLLALTLRDLEAGRLSVGFGKSRGLGQVSGRVAKLTVRYPACILDGDLRLPGRDQPATPADWLPGVGVFPGSAEYGSSGGRDTVQLPAGAKLVSDEWGEPLLELTDGKLIRDLWIQCSKAWRRTVEEVTV